MIENYPASDSTFKSNLFTIKFKQIITQCNIPGDQSLTIQYARDAKGTAFIGITLNQYFDEDVKLYRQRESQRISLYNAKTYSKNALPIKEKKRETYAISSFKTEYFKRKELDINNPKLSKTYNRMVRLGLIHKVFNSDNSINWDETLRMTAEARDKYVETIKPTQNKDVKKDLSKHNNNKLIIESQTNKKIVLNIVKPKLNINKEIDNDVPINIWDRFTRSDDYIIKDFPDIKTGLTLEEFDKYRYLNYIDQKHKYDLMENYKDVIDTPDGSPARKRIWDVANKLGDIWYDLVVENDYDKYDELLFNRDKEMDFEENNTWEKIALKTDYEDLLKKLNIN